MTWRDAAAAPRSRILPAVVFSLFALMILVDLAVVVFFGNYRNLVEEDGIVVSFRSDTATADAVAAVEIPDGGRVVSTDGRVQAQREGDRLAVFSAGELMVRFRAPNAGGEMEMTYRFAERRADGRCEISVARVASRYGVDVVRRKELVAAKRRRGRFRHHLADHAGWFMLSLRVNQAAADQGFEVTLPTITWRR
jgi:hypothetical protein